MKSMPPFFKCQAVENQLGKLFFEKLHFEMSDNLDIKSGLVAKHSDLEKLAWKIYPDQNGSFLWRMLQKIIHFFVKDQIAVFRIHFHFYIPESAMQKMFFKRAEWTPLGTPFFARASSAP